MPRKAAPKSPKMTSKMPAYIPKPPKERSAKGTFIGKDAAMKANTYEAFKAWYDDRQPKILTKGRYEYVALTRKQESTLKRILVGDGKGGFKHAMSIVIWPRRHSKSVMLRLICLWLADTRDNLTIQLWGNSEQHSRRVQFGPMAKIIQNTYSLRLRFPEKNLQRWEIGHVKNGSKILAMVGGSVVYGDKIDVLYVDDYHNNQDLPAVNALQAALLDQDNALMLIGSNVDSVDGHVHQLQKLAATDPGIYADHLEYMDWLHYEAMAPSWIDRAAAKRLEKTTLPSEFARDILGQRTQAQNSLFEVERIEACKSPYAAPVTDLKALTQGRSYKIGAGLDRSKALLGEASGGGRDNTILTIIAKVARSDGEPEIIVLDQINVIPNTGQYIKSLIRKAHDAYKLDNLTLEDYQAVDIEPWCIEQNIPVELISAHSTRQNASFPELHRIVKEGRLHFPNDMTDLVSEMQSFQYTALKGDKYSFGAAGSGHDDRVYSLNWAIYSLRKEILANYVLANIQCSRRQETRQFCILLGGDMELYCSRQCMAFRRVEDMFREFKRFETESHLTIGQFYKRYVKLTGALITQAV